MREPTPLERELRERIAREGPLSFSEVMQAALYDPEYGYYTNLRGFGALGDFITSPERHPVFGWLLGRQALDVWQVLGRPAPFRILEIGGGTGALAQSLMLFLRDAIPQVEYTLDEVSPALRTVQRQRLTGSEYRWERAEEPRSFHFLIANEVADALPVHRFVVRCGRFRELRVGVDARDEMTFVESEEAPTHAHQRFDEMPPEGSLVDIALGLGDWVRGVAQRLDQRGVALVVDYMASPPRDSLLTYYRHSMGSDPLVRLGQQDISAHVDLRSLVRHAVGLGLRAEAISQRGMLFNLGFRQVQARLSGPTDQQALAHLVDAKGAGGQITAVFLSRGLPADSNAAGVVGREWPMPGPGDIRGLDPDPDELDFLSQWREAFPA